MTKKLLWLPLILFALLFTITPLAAQQANTVYATAQQFEHGLMIWRSDTADIWVLGDNGQALNYPIPSYVNLPDNPIFGTPSSRLRPIFAFGKVWGNFAESRNLLGWPTLPEIGFNMPLAYERSVYYLTQLDHSVIVIYGNNTWARVNPQPAQPRIVNFTANADAVPPNSSLMVNWAVEGAEFVIVELYDNQSSALLSTISDLPLAGSTTLTMPASAPNGVRVNLVGARYVRPSGFVAVRTRLLESSLAITVRPIEATTTTTYAAFQQYERGFMIWRGDTGMVYAFYGSTGGLTGGWLQSDYEGLPDNLITNPPAGLITPVNGFGRVWGNNQAVRDTLGWAIGAEQGYTLTITSYPQPPVYFDPAYFTLPDGRTVAFASYGRYWSVQ